MQTIRKHVKCELLKSKNIQYIHRTESIIGGLHNEYYELNCSIQVLSLRKYSSKTFIFKKVYSALKKSPINVSNSFHSFLITCRLTALFSNIKNIYMKESSKYIRNAKELEKLLFWGI